MTAKEKPRELVKRYYSDSDLLVEYLTWKQAKECALIAVDEVFSVISIMPYGITYLSNLEYWHDVKEEIEKL